MSEVWYCRQCGRPVVTAIWLGSMPYHEECTHGPGWQPQHYTLTPTNDERVQALVKAAVEAADDLEAEIRARAVGELPRRIERDLQSVAALRAALAPFQQANAK